MSKWLLVLAACSSEGQPHVVPAELALADEAAPLRIEGLASSDFLATRGGDVALAATYRIAEVPVTVQAADASGVTVTLGGALPVGKYSLDVAVGGRSWHVEDALAISDDGAVDAGVDAATGCPAAPTGCAAFSCASTHCYYVCESVTGASADAQCNTRGLGCLATVDDAAENACLEAATGATDGSPAWIGLANSGNGTWTWDCDDGSAYTNWKPTTPPKGVGCAQLVNGGKWNSKDCSEKARFICEL